MPLYDPFGQSQMPAEFADRETKVALVGQVAQDLIARGGAANLYVGGALLKYLEQGGNLERHYLRVAEQGSHITPQMLWRRIQQKQK